MKIKTVAKTVNPEILPEESKSSQDGDGNSVKVALWGLFGQQNIGNELTIEAILHNCEIWAPYACPVIVCSDPVDAESRYGIQAVAIDASDQGNESSTASDQKRGGIFRVGRIVGRRIPGEIQEWVRTYQTMKGMDILLLCGTGLLTDYATSARSYPYEILKWSLLARMSGSKVRIISVGTGPLRQSLSRLFIRMALRLADYRSFRDEVSRKRLVRIGAKVEKDPIIPDAAFSLPESFCGEHGESRRTGGRSVVGVGVMNYVGKFGINQDGGAIAGHYLDQTAGLIMRIVEKGYGVRILHGDMHYDTEPRADLKRLLERRGADLEGGEIVDEDVKTTSEFISQLSGVDLVISPRYHNQLLGLMRGLPVISLSYDPKSDALMDSVGLSDYRFPIENFEVEEVLERVDTLFESYSNMWPGVREHCLQNRRLLEGQYREVLTDS
jgi:polysaccharide pyruvyl transferase WcaK-like protein